MILVDTSIWGRLAYKSDPLHAIAKNALQQAIRTNTGTAIAAQSLYELWVVATRPVANNGLGWSPSRITNWITMLQRNYLFLPEDPAIFEIWKQTPSLHATSGKSAHDARLVAAMQFHGVDTILTFNAKDFVRYGVKIIDPQNPTSPPAI